MWKVHFKMDWVFGVGVPALPSKEIDIFLLTFEGTLLMWVSVFASLLGTNSPLLMHT